MLERNKYILCTLSEKVKKNIPFPADVVDNVQDLMQMIEDNDSIEVILIGDKFLYNVDSIRKKTNAALIILCKNSEDGKRAIKYGADDYILDDNLSKNKIDESVRFAQCKRKIFTTNCKLQSLFEKIGS